MDLVYPAKEAKASNLRGKSFGHSALGRCCCAPNGDLGQDKNFIHRVIVAWQGGAIAGSYNSARAFFGKSQVTLITLLSNYEWIRKMLAPTLG